MIIALLVWALGGDADRALHQALHLGDHSFALRWALRLTDLGGAAVMIPVALLACAWLIARRQPARALCLFTAIALGRFLVDLAKRGFDRPRPPTADWLAHVSDLSFPSSHAAGATMTCLMLCLAFDARRGAWLAAGLFALSIGSTRVALGVHWPSDVLAGWGFGLAWTMLWARWLPPYRQAQMRG